MLTFSCVKVKMGAIVTLSCVVMMMCIVIAACTAISHTESFINAKIMLNSANTGIFLINMKRNPERLERFKQQYDASDLSQISFKRIEGVDGKRIAIEDFVSKRALEGIIIAERNGYRKHHYELTRGAVGCFLSHLNVYKAIAADKSKDFGLVFEDDARFVTPAILNDLNQEIATLPEDWDILLLGCVCFVCGKYSAYYEVNRFFLLHAYVIRRKVAERLVDVLSITPIEQQIDAVFSDMAEKNELKIYCLKNKLAIQWNMGTTIQLPVKETPGVDPFERLSGGSMKSRS